MTLTVTQLDFERHFKTYLDLITINDETILIVRPDGQMVIAIVQEKFLWLERAVQANEDSLDYAVAIDYLIQQQILPDNPVVSGDCYWNQFKN